MKKIYTILVVEDDPSWQKNFELFFESDAFVIHTATNSQDAISLINEHIFDLAILDINLTNVPHNYDGLRIGQYIWNKNKRIKIIIVSGSDITKNEKRLSSFHFLPSAILAKQTLNQQDFIETIHTVLAKPTLWD